MAGTPTPFPYVEDGSEEISEMGWEGGYWEADDEQPTDYYNDTGDTPDTGGEELPPVGGSPAEHWREELQTTGQRIAYVNNVLGLSRGNAGYSNALRYIGLIAEGKRHPESDRWVKVQRVAELNYELKHRDIPPPLSSGGGPQGPGSFRRGDYLTGAVSWQMEKEDYRREVSGTVTLEGESLKLANDGQLAKAFIRGYFDGNMS